MKNILYIGLAFLLFCGCHPEPVNEHKLHLIFLVDTIDADMVSNFKTLLKPFKDFPADRREIIFTLYQANMDDSDIPASAKFTCDQGDKNDRKREFKSFIDPLYNSVTNQFKEKNILHCIDRIYNSIDDNSVEYHVYIISKMAEDSGEALNPDSENNSRVNGHFHFINGDGECVSAEINAANKQLRDSSSWINRHLIKIQNNNSNLHRCKVKTEVYQLPLTANANQTHSKTSGKDDIDISNFWKNLFKGMNITYTYSKNKFHIVDVKSFINKGV